MKSRSWDKALADKKQAAIAAAAAAAAAAIDVGDGDAGHELWSGCCGCF